MKEAGVGALKPSGVAGRMPPRKKTLPRSSPLAILGSEKPLFFKALQFRLLSMHSRSSSFRLAWGTGNTGSLRLSSRFSGEKVKADRGTSRNGEREIKKKQLHFRLVLGHTVFALVLGGKLTKEKIQSRDRKKMSETERLRGRKGT